MALYNNYEYEKSFLSQIETDNKEDLNYYVKYGVFLYSKSNKQFKNVYNNLLSDFNELDSVRKTILNEIKKEIQIQYLKAYDIEITIHKLLLDSLSHEKYDLNKLLIRPLIDNLKARNKTSKLLEKCEEYQLNQIALNGVIEGYRNHLLGLIKNIKNAEYKLKEFQDQICVKQV